MKMPCRNARAGEGHTFDIGQSRQKLTEGFMSIPEATHILFVDDDIAIPHGECLIGMFNFLEEHKEYIISGLYLEGRGSSHPCSECKRPTHRPIILGFIERGEEILFVFPYATKPVPRKQIINVHAVPAGFLLVKREAFEKIPPPWFIFNDPELVKKNKGRRVGEDIYFSLKARKAGLKLWVDTRASLLHYAPDFVGLPEDLAFIHGGSDNVKQEAAKLREEYLDELSKSKSRTET